MALCVFPVISVVKKKHLKKILIAEDSMTEKNYTVNELIENSEVFKGDKKIAEIARNIFDFTRFLLDNDENLTRTGNLNANAKETLRKRTMELLGDDTDFQIITPL